MEEKEATTMLALIGTQDMIGLDSRARRLVEGLEAELSRVVDDAVGIVLAPWTIDFSHMEWSSRDETWM